MKKLAIYLDTSVLNFLFADDAPEKRDITREFFEQLKERKYDAYVSDVVVDEISRADPDKRDALLKIIADYELGFLDVTDEVVGFAGKVLEAGIVPKAKTQDALHIAVAVCSGADVLLSGISSILQISTRNAM